MKKLLIFATIISCMFTFVACGNNDSSKKETKPNNKTSSSDVGNSNEDGNKKEFDAPSILDEIIENNSFSDMTKLEDALFLEVMYGISEADVKQFAMYINETGIIADEIIIIEAVDDEASKRFCDLITNWYISKGAQMKDYLPEEYKKIEKSSVKSSGNYVYMVIADNNSEIEKIIEKYI